MSNNYPEPPRTDWAELALLSEAADPEDYRDIHGAVIDDENWRQIKEQVIVPFDTYADIPDPGPFDGAKAEDLQSNVVFRWDETAGEWIALNTGTSSNPVPGTSHFESLSTDETDTDLLKAETPFVRSNEFLDVPSGETTTLFDTGVNKSSGLLHVTAIKTTDPTLQNVSEIVNVRSINGSATTSVISTNQDGSNLNTSYEFSGINERNIDLTVTDSANGDPIDIYAEFIGVRI